jgi:predicted transcriptional regulator
MRTTVDIDDALLERAKRLALKEKQTLGAVLGQALAAYLGSRRQSGKDPPFELIVAGSARGRFPTAAEIAAVEEADEVRALAIPSRKRDAAP